MSNGYNPKVLNLNLTGQKLSIRTDKPMPIGSAFGDLYFQLGTKYYMANGIFAMSCVKFEYHGKTYYRQTCGFLKIILIAEEVHEDELWESDDGD